MVAQYQGTYQSIGPYKVHPTKRDDIYMIVGRWIDRTDIARVLNLSVSPTANLKITHARNVGLTRKKANTPHNNFCYHILITPDTEELLSNRFYLSPSDYAVMYIRKKGNKHESNLYSLKGYRTLDVLLIGETPSSDLLRKLYPEKMHEHDYLTSLLDWTKAFLRRFYLSPQGRELFLYRTEESLERVSRDLIITTLRKRRRTERGKQTTTDLEQMINAKIMRFFERAVSSVYSP